MNKLKNIGQDMKAYYNASAKYNELMQVHSEEYFTTYLNLIDRQVKALSLSMETIIDLGCASGASTFYIALNYPEVKCLGVDISAKNIEYAKKNYSLPNLKYEVGNCEVLDKANGSFSIVTSFDVIEHLPNTEVALQEMIRIVKRGGVIIIKCPNIMNPLLPIVDILLLRSRYPFTPTWLHNFPRFFKVSCYFIQNLLNSSVTFTSRVPDLSDTVQVGRDADATYEVSPLDLIKFFKKKGFQVKNVACPRRNTFLAKVYSRLFPLCASVGLVVCQDK